MTNRHDDNDLQLASSLQFLGKEMEELKLRVHILENQLKPEVRTETGTKEPGRRTTTLEIKWK